MPEIIAGRYAILDGEKSRTGAHSSVRKAVDLSSANVFCAVKFIVGKTDVMTDLIFQREVDSLTKASHPNVVALLDHGIDDTETPYLVLPWVERTFLDLLQANDQGSASEILDNFIYPLASAMSHLHLLSVEHRDIKPANVLIDNVGNPLLADFSIGKDAKDEANKRPDQTLQRWRTDLYAPPESTDTMRYVRDVFSLGALFALSLPGETLTEQHQFQSALMEANLPQEVRDLFVSCVSFDPAERPSSGAVLFSLLKSLRGAAAAASSARTHRVWIELKSSVRQAIVGEHGRLDDAEKVLAADLATAPYVSFRGVHDRDTLQLVGNSIRCVLKVDYAKGTLHVISAKREAFEVLEWARRGGLPTRDFLEFKMGRPLVLDRAQRSLAALVAHIEQTFGDDGTDPRKADETALLDLWKSQLDAREEVAKGGRSNLSFKGATAVGSDIVVELSAAPEDDLVTSQWELKGSANSSYGARVEIVNQTGNHVTLRWRSRPMTTTPASGILAPNLGPTQVALRRQNDAVRILEQSKSVLEGLLPLLVDPSQSKPPTPVPEPEWRTEIDEDKRAAVKAALGLQDIMIVKGPPGTGKTRLIGEIVAQTLDQDSAARILVVSQTHAAVDNALIRLDAAGVKGVVRLGKADDPRVSASVKHLLLDEQMGLWAGEVRAKAEQHMNRLAEGAGIKPRHLRAASLLEQLVSVAREQEALERHILQAGSSERADDLTSELTSPQDPVDLQVRLDRLAEEHASLTERAEYELAGDLAIGASPQVSDLQAAVSILLEQASRGPELLQLLSLQADWLQRVFSDISLADTFLKTTSVVAGTCIGFLGHPAARLLEFDLCIFDEASKATATESLVPLVKAKKSVLVGDSRQLPPLDEDLLRQTKILKDFNLTPEIVKETLFERLSRDLPDHSQFQLSDQHRMTRAIGDLISSCFYDDRLNSLNADVLQGYEAIAKPLLWLDTCDAGNQRREEVDVASNGSFINRYEAAVINERLKTLDRAIDKGLVLIPSGRTKLETFLIAPYRSQLETLNRATAEWTPKHLDVTIESIDAVQGREADVVFLSVTRSNNRRSLGFLAEDYWRRINVALSRARFALVIVGDGQFCDANPGALGDVFRYMEANSNDCEIRGTIV